MASESRAHKSILNARMNLLFYVLVLAITFFSRRIFLEKLGDDFVGLTSTLANLLGLLNLAELGIGGAVGYMLYKPLVNGQRQEINEIVSVLGYAYRKIGWIVIAGAAILAIFLPWILDKSPFSNLLIYYTFLCYLVSAVLGYFINYRQLLLNADQRQYVVTAYYQSANILRLFIQMLVLYKTANPYWWVTIEISFSIIYSLILNVRINKTYPWLKTTLKEGKALLKKYPEFIKYTKQIFVHRLGYTVLNNLSPVFVYAYTSLAMVAFYTNYTLIITKVQQLASQLLGSADAGVGQLVAEGNTPQVLKVFAEIFALRYWVTAVLVGALWFAINPFISLWVGVEYVLPSATVALILLNLFIMFTRICDSFISAYGLFYDTWAPITEAALNAGLSILLGHFWGLNGVLLGTTFSMLAIVVVWKPYFLYSKGFSLSVWLYWKRVARHLAILIPLFGGVCLLDHIVAFDPAAHGWGGWVLYASLITALMALLFWGGLYLGTDGMRTLTQRLYTMVRNRLVKR